MNTPRIVIVEDDVDKRNAMLRACKEALAKKGVVDAYGDVAAARMTLKDEQATVLVMDICLPAVANGAPRVDVGIEFIRELTLQHGTWSPPVILAISSESDALAYEDDDALAGVAAWIQRDEMGRWRKRLIEKIRYFIVAQRDNKSRRKFEFDLAIVCGLDDPELDEVRRIKWGWKPDYTSKSGECDEFFVGKLVRKGRTRRIVACAAQQMGMAAAATLATKVINRYRPRYIVACGVAAGVRGAADDDIQYGDALVADLSWDYGCGKLVEENGKVSLKPDGRFIDLDPELKRIFLDVRRRKSALASIGKLWKKREPSSDGRPIGIHIGPVGTGAAVVASRGVVEELKAQQRKMIGLEMEIYGVYYAARHASVPRPAHFAIKCVSDYANEEKSDKHKRYAAFVSSQLLKYVVEKFLFKL